MSQREKQDEELPKLEIVDDRVYVNFGVRELKEVDGLKYEVYATDKEHDELPLPIFVTKFSLKRTAHVVSDICFLLFSGKKVYICQTAVGLLKKMRAV